MTEKDKDKQLSELKKQINALNNEIKSLGGDAYKNLDKIFDGFNGDIKEAQKFLKQLSNEASDLKNVFGNISTTLRNVVKDLQGATDPAKIITNSFSKLEGISNKLLYHRKEEDVLTVKQLKATSRQVELEYEKLKLQRDELKLLIDSGKATDKQKAVYEEVNQALRDNKSYLKDLLKETEKTLQTEKEIQKTLGITGALFKGIQGTLQKIGIESEHFEDMNKNLREAAKSGNAFKVLGTGIKEIFKGIGSALKDPVVIMGLLTTAFSKLYTTFTAFSQAGVDLARNFGIARKEGDQLQKQFLDISSSSESLSATVPNISEAFIDLNNVTGTFANLSSETLTTYTDLTKALGVSKETAGTFYKLSLVTGKSFKKTTEEILGQTKYQKEQLGTSLSEKTIMEGIAKSTAAQRLSLRGGTEELIQSVIQAKKLGVEISQLEGIADNLLNIESSIAAEQSAELITGRELNLEAARYYANTNQTEKLAAVLSKDIGTAAQFQKMSRIEAETLAAAYGLSRDQLAEMLENKEMQDKLDKVGVRSEEELAQKFANRKLTLEQIQKLGGKELKDKALNLSFQEKLNNLMDKFKAAFVTELAPYFEKFADRFDNFIKGGGLKKFIDGVKTLASGIGKAIEILTSKTVLTILGGLVGLKALTSVKNLVFGQPGSSAMRPMYTKEVGFGGGGGSSGGGGMLSGLTDRLSQYAPGSYKEFTKSGAYTLNGKAYSKSGTLLKGAASDAVFSAKRMAAPVGRGTSLMRGFGKFGASKLGKFAGGPGGLIAGLAIDPLTSMISDKFKGPNGEATTASDATDVIGGTASGALTGAAIGSVIPVVGTAIGGIIGGAIGLISGLSDIDKRKSEEAVARKQLKDAVANNNNVSKAKSTTSLVSKYQSFGSPSTSMQGDGVEKTNSLLENIYNAVSTSKPIMMNGNQVGVGVGFDNYQMQ
jgi:uncharacterized protein YukE